ncbi:hypothetical protein [Bradyrhizobium sp. CCGUVB14]|nr:hypothetical protein [Bradyrhizobium sp. CCGUVB14]MCP3441318.1 hypothetical protein [Bradyrhizobium sp. CCGUVB14]
MNLTIATFGAYALSRRQVAYAAITSSDTIGLAVAGIKEPFVRMVL